MIDSVLNKKITIGKLELANKVIIQPMEGCDGKADGGITQLVRRRYLRFAKSGVGLIWFEATAVCAEGRANPRQLYLTEKNKNEFKDLLDEIRSTAKQATGVVPKIIVQLTHSGRQSRPVDLPRPIYASDNAYLDKVKPLTDNAVYASTDYLASLPEKFAKSAILAREVGFDGVDVKCCHGYCYNELMSAYSRTDCYGGENIENRAKLYLQTFEKVVQAVGNDMEVTSRFGVYDGFDYPYGFGVNEKNECDLSEAFYTIDKLIEMGMNMLNITIGNPYINPHVNRPYKAGSPEDGNIGVERIRKITAEIQKRFPNLAVVMSGMTYDAINSLLAAEKCLEQNMCTLVGFGRMSFAYPEFYQDYLANGKLDKTKVCITCGNCSKMMRAGGVSGCPIRDKEQYGELFAELVLKRGK